MANKVLKGQYQGKAVGQALGRAYIVNGLKKVNIDDSTVKAFEKQDESAKRTIGGIVAFGILAPKKRQMIVKVEWRDGGKSLIECDEKVFKAITAQCFE